MNIKKRYTFFIALAVIITACGAPSAAPEQPGIETIVASTLQAYTQNAPAVAPTNTAVTGILLSAEGLSLTAPVGLANSFALSIEPAVPPADDMPWWGIYPEHKIYAMQGYPLTGTFHEPKLYLYPVDEYVAMNDDVAAKVQSLKNILANPSQPLPERLPFVPTWNAGQEFYSNVQVVSFQNGSGIRYLTQYGQFPSAVSNTSVFYTYQGITSDGKYYVSAVLPISAPFLPAQSNADSPVPSDGVPFDWNDPMNNQGYFPLVAEKLNSTDPALFNPTLPTLDSLIQSILIP